MKENEYIEILVAKVLSSEASSAEIAELENWINADSTNMDYFKLLEKTFLNVNDIKPEHFFDTDQAWIEVKSKLETGNSDRKIINISRDYNLFFRVAAVIVLVVGIAFAVNKIFNEPTEQKIQYASNNVVEEFKLPDSTQVVLNRNSNISVSYSSERRLVKLKGEAFFDIAADPDRKFEIEAAGITIRDIGTAFNVKAIEGSDSVIVIVQEGEVILSSDNAESINLVKGEQGIYSKNTNVFIKTQLADSNAVAYKTKIFVFENAVLEAAISKLNEVYAINIVLDEKIKACHITATFRNEKSDAIIDVIAETLKLKVSRLPGKILIEGEGCE